jgi:hypothetical protein
MHKALLLCGLLSSLVYAAINIVVPFRWAEYSVIDQTVSELSAIGTPTRSLWLMVVIPYIVLFAAFGLALVREADGSRWLRLAGWLIVVSSAFNIYWPPMHRREVLAASGGTLTDTLHLVWASMTVLLFVLIMAFAAAAMGSRFRAYTIGSTAVLLASGVLTWRDASNVAANLPTPWIGVWERISIGVFLLWVAVLSLALWPRARQT